MKEKQEGYKKTGRRNLQYKRLDTGLFKTLDVFVKSIILKFKTK